jgi:hypothetical protein
VISPDAAERCDCGYDFKTKLMKSSYIRTKSSATLPIDGSFEALDPNLIAELVREKGRRDVTVGGLFLAGGLVVTLVTYSMASSGGGTYVIAHGAVIFGALQLMRGIFRVRTGRLSRFWDVKL